MIIYFLLLFICTHARLFGRFGEPAFETWNETPRCVIVSAGPFELQNTNDQCVVYECSSIKGSMCYKRDEKARDGQAFVSFIVQHYTSLPFVTFFVHGHKNAWHQHHLIRFDSFQQFSGLNHHPIEVKNFSSTPYGDIWRAIFPHMKTPEHVCCDGSLQFMVHRDRIQKQPLSTWIELEHYLYGTKVWPGSNAWNDKGVSLAPGDFKGSSYFVEWIMHVLLGEPWCKFYR